MEWQPIETAPKDGTPILVFSPYADISEPTNIIVAKYGKHADETWWEPCENLIRDAIGCVDPAPTHWMPLPKPPGYHPGNHP